MTEPRQYAAVRQTPLRAGDMAIGEFGGAPAAAGDNGPMYAAPAYWLYEMSQAALNPSRAFADAARLFYRNPANPLSYTAFGKTMAASLELFERSTRRYGKPEWNISSTVVGGEHVPVHISTLWQRPFCRLLHFERAFEHAPRRPQPRLLIVAPMSGHYPTLLRGTVEGFLPNHDVFLTEWVDARMVPVSEGGFDLDDYIDYLISMLHLLGGDVHMLAVCQPSVPVLAAVARMEAEDDPYVPDSMVLMGGPIDTRVNPTAVNVLAERRGVDWFRRNVITKVPFPNPGFMRDFYDEYLAVMDLAAEFYLQTVDTVFVRHALPKGEMTHRGIRIDPANIRRVALLTVEGENDDISGVGQTEAAHRLCVNIPASRKAHWLQPAVGLYGVFNGSRFRAEIVPRVSDFVLSNNAARARSVGKRAPKRAGAPGGAVLAP